MMRMMAVVAMLVASPALAGGPMDDMFPTDASCYLRHYDKAHLAAHPDQVVREIAIGPMNGWPAEPGTRAMKLAVSFRGDNEIYTGVAICTNDGDGAWCFLEGDAGAFGVTARKGGEIVLEVGRQGMIFEGSRDFREVSGTSGDDRSFRMPRVPADSCP